eukprot:gene23004-30196_t
MAMRSSSGRRVSNTRGVASSLSSRSAGCPTSFSESLERGGVDWSWKSAGFRSASGHHSGRTISSSPTEGNCETSQAAPQFGFATPLAHISGFNCPVVKAPSSQSVAEVVKSPGKMMGGLAMALGTHQEEEALSPRGKNVPSNFFPEVDLTALEEAQAEYAVFNTEIVSTAYMLASRAYKGEMRLDGTNQLSHCMIVAQNLADLGLDPETVAAAILHESMRHSDAFRAQLEEFLPSSVIQLVDRVTAMSKISQLYRNHRDEISDERLQDMLVAMEDVKAVIIKLGCRLHNMKTIGYLPMAKQKLMAQETLDIYSVVANRLGVWHLKAELEDVAFSVLHPKEYKALREQAAARQDPELLEETINTIKANMDAAGVEYVDISGRPKNVYGIWKKMKADNMTSLTQVYDVTALRVVVRDKHDCYRAQRVVQSVYRCMHNRSKDFIKVIKKPNGYQSLHETIYGAGDVPAEVQIRTHKMHYIAEYGFAAHWKYKENLSNEDTWLDKEVQYKKWLTAYKLGVHDKKVRPSGSPPTDSSLKALGMHLIDTDPGLSTSGEYVGSPEVDPFLRHERFKLLQPSRSSVSVVVQTQDGVKARDLACGMTVAQLGRELSITSLSGYALTVNQRLPAEGVDVTLQSGDLVQVLPISEVLGRSQNKRESEMDLFGIGGQNNILPINPASMQRVMSGSGVPTFKGFFPSAMPATEPFFSAPSSWAALSSFVWIAYIFRRGWGTMSAWDKRQAIWGILSVFPLLHYLHLDQEFEGWGDVYFFCGRDLRYCTCNFRWNLLGWGKALVLWSFVLSMALGVQRFAIEVGLGGLLPGEEVVTKESFISICWRLIPYWLNNWEQQWGAECSSMTFELPHFAMELLVILPCVQILATPLVNVAAPAPGQEPEEFVRDNYAPNILKGYWEYDPRQKKILQRLKYETM